MDKEVERVWIEVDAYAEWLDMRIGQARDMLSDNKELHAELCDLLSYEYLPVLAVRHKTVVDRALRFLWGNYGRSQVQKILDNPNVSHHQLLVLSDLLHDNVPYELDIDPVMESVSYALGNDNLFGKKFETVILYRAVIQD